MPLKSACLLAVSLAACALSCGTVCGGNIGFMPGDAFFHTALREQLLTEFDSDDRSLTLRYAQPAGTASLCGYAGFWRLRLQSVPPELVENLRRVYESLSRNEAKIVQVFRDERGKTVQTELSGYHLFVYGRDCDVQDIYHRGQLVQGIPSTWQYLDEFFSPGKQLTMRPTGEKQLILAYSGFRNLLTPLPALGNLLPKSLTAEYDLGVPLSPFVFGTDPIPNQQLFGKASVNFVMPGGKGEPTAVAIYSGTTKRLEVPPVQLREKAIRRLLASQRQ